MWATCNVGASKPSDYGLYFQWGDTVGYTTNQVGKDKQFNSADYKWNPSGDGETFTKYNKTDNKTVLDLEDDAAHVNMGGDWQMPTEEQIEELINKTTSKWSKQNGVSGMTFTSKNDTSKSIFIPATGHVWNGSFYGSGVMARGWSSSVYTYDFDSALYFEFASDGKHHPAISRVIGLPIRGVIDKK